MKYLNYILFFTALCCFQSCYEDAELTTVTTQQIDPSVSYRNNLSGIVQDTDREPLADVQLEINGMMAITDNNGAFSIDNVLLPEIGTFLSSTREGYINTGIRLYPAKSLSQALTITMVDEQISFSVDNSIGANLEDQSGLQVNFPPESVLDNGQVYNGTYSVTIFYINPKDDNGFEKQIRAYDIELETNPFLPRIDALSMAYIEVKDENGKVLNISSNTPVQVKFPTVEGQSNLPSSADLLSFDKDKGLWVEESTAVLENNKYVAELSHFSWWTVSNIVSAEELCITFESTLSDPPSDNIYVVNTASGNHVFFGRVDYNNPICQPVPNDDNLVISVYSYCLVKLEEIILSSTLINEPLTISTNDNVDGYNIAVSIIDCQDQPFAGQFIVSYSNASQVLEVDSNKFDLEIGSCLDKPELNIVVEDKNDGSLHAATLALDPNQTSYDLEIQICGDTPDPGVLILNGKTFQNCVAQVNPEEVIIYSDDPGILIGFDIVQSGKTPCRIISSTATELGSADIKEFGNINEYISGTFEATDVASGEIIKGSFSALRIK